MNALEAGVRDITAQAAGVLNLHIITSAMGIQLIAALVLGDPEAAMLLRAITECADGIRHAPRNEPALCLCCPRSIRRLTPRTVFGVAVPATLVASRAIGFAFCDSCGKQPDELVGKTLEALRQIWPALRPIAVTHEAGGCA